jgi:hypothetical protein
VDPERRRRAEAARGYLPAAEGLALYEAGLDAARSVPGAPLVEIGTWCGKSALYLATAAAEAGTVLFTVDHHHGSEEQQPGWEHHDPDLVDPRTGRLDTLAAFRRTIAEAGVEDVVVAVVGESATVARHWTTPAALVFIDGGHGVEPARADFRGWSPVVAVGGLLAIHDVFPNPADGGRPPYEELYLPALAAGFVEVRSEGSLRVLRRP